MTKFTNRRCSACDTWQLTDRREVPYVCRGCEAKK